MSIKCPLCGANTSYVGLKEVDCINTACKNYSSSNINRPTTSNSPNKDFPYRALCTNKYTILDGPHAGYEAGPVSILEVAIQLTMRRVGTISYKKTDYLLLDFIQKFWGSLTRKSIEDKLQELGYV